MAGYVKLSEVRSGAATLEDLMKINAILDSRAAAEEAAAAKEPRQ